MRVITGQPRVYGPHKLNPRIAGVSMASRSNRDGVHGRESFDLLNSFFYGKALAEVLNERMGNMAADILAELGTAEAELRKALDEIQEEVIVRAQREISQSMDSSGQLPSPGASPTLVDEDEAVDNLRAEIASTRSLIQQSRKK